MIDSDTKHTFKNKKVMILFDIDTWGGAMKMVALFSLILTSFAIADDSKSVVENELSYAVAYCLSHSYPNTEFSNDAKYISGTYIHKGSFGIDMYEDIRAFVDEYMKNKYTSKYKKNLNIMQCIDLYHSKGLIETINANINKPIQKNANESSD